MYDSFFSFVNIINKCTCPCKYSKPLYKENMKILFDIILIPKRSKVCRSIKIFLL